MRRLLHALLVGLIGAGIVHIAVLLLVPRFSETGAWARLAMAADLYRMTPLAAETGAATVVKSVDPLFAAAACRFDLGDGMVHVKAPPSNLPFWSISVYDRDGHNTYSFNDHGAAKSQLDAVVLTPAQMNDVRKDLPQDFQGSVFIQTPIKEGILVVRGFVPDDSWKPQVTAFLKGATCNLRQP